MLLCFSAGAQIHLGALTTLKLLMATVLLLLNAVLHCTDCVVSHSNVETNQLAVTVGIRCFMGVF